jgi:hypothetical protein
MRLSLLTHLLLSVSLIEERLKGRHFGKPEMIEAE